MVFYLGCQRGMFLPFPEFFFFYSFIPFFVRCTVWPQGKLTGHWYDHTYRFYPSPPSEKKALAGRYSPVRAVIECIAFVSMSELQCLYFCRDTEWRVCPEQTLKQSTYRHFSGLLLHTSRAKGKGGSQ